MRGNLKSLIKKADLLQMQVPQVVELLLADCLSNSERFSPSELASYVAVSLGEDGGTIKAIAMEASF